MTRTHRRTGRWRPDVLLPPRVARLVGRHRGLHRRGAAADVPRRGRPGGDRPVRDLGQRAGELHRGAAGGLRRLQVPAGLLLDRFGPRILIATGAAFMALGQTLLAVSPNVPLALTGRVLVGAGDAVTFISMLRLVTAWLPPRRVPVMTQVTGILGQVGQLLSAVPFVALLHLSGWTSAFLAAAGLSVFVGILVVLVVRDSPSGSLRRHDAVTLRQAGHDLRSAWQHPGTRLGLWTHFTTQFSGTVFALLWGYPFLVSGEGLSRGGASALFTLLVLVGALAAPFLGVMVQRHPLRRSWLVLTIVGLNITAWTVVLSWPGPAPTALLVVLVVTLALGGPGSMIGFDFARTFNPPARL